MADSSPPREGGGARARWSFGLGSFGVLCIAIALVTVVVWTNARIKQLRAQLDALRRTYATHDSARPAWRGASRECNAPTEQVAAVMRIPALDEPLNRDVSEALQTGRPVAAQTQRFVDTNTEALDALLRSTECRRAWTPVDPQSGLSSSSRLDL